MPERIPQSTTLRVSMRAYLSTDHLSVATGKTIPITISKNGAAFGNPSGGATNATEIANGWYYVDLTTTDTGTAGPLIVYGTLAGIDNVELAYDVEVFPTFPPNFSSTLINSAGQVQSDTVLLAGTASAGGSNTITLAGGSTTDNLYKYAIVGIVSGTGAGQARLIVDYVGSTKVATVNKNWTTTPDATSIFRLTPFGTPAVVHSGIAQAGAASTITLQTIADSTHDNIYNGLTITIFSGTGAFQSRIIQSYVSSTRVATIDRAWTTNPDSTSIYEISALGPSWADVFAWNSKTVPTTNVDGVPIIDIKYLLGTVFTEGAVGRLVAGVKQFFNVASPTSTMNEVTLVDTTTALTNAPGAGDFTAAMKTSLNAAMPASVQNIAAQTGDSFARLGAPAGVSVSADIAEVEAETDGISAIPTNPLLTTDTRLNNLDATVSSRLATASLISDSGTAQTGSATNIRLRSGAPAVGLTGQTVFINGGTGAGQSSPITAYNTGTKDATTVWTTNPDATSTYVVIAAQGGSSGSSSLTAAQVWAYVGTGGVTEDAALNSIYSKVQTNPVTVVGLANLAQTTFGPFLIGDDYFATDGSRNMVITSPYPSISLLGATTVYKGKQRGQTVSFQVTGNVLSASQVSFEFPASITSLMQTGFASVESTLSSGHVLTIAFGQQLTQIVQGLS